MKKIYYIANARMPSKKAYGIQIAKMCEALAEEGYDITLVCPRRGEAARLLRDFYGLRADIRLVHLPAVFLQKYERAGYALMSASFMFSYCLFLGWKRLRGERFSLYGVDTDTFSFALLPLFGPAVVEMHGPKEPSILMRYVARRARGVVAVNQLIAQALLERFPALAARLLVEPNGADPVLPDAPAKNEARRRLNLPPDRKLALYAGRFYPWKGLGILAQAAQRLGSEVSVLALGGSREAFEGIFGPAGDMRFAEALPSEVPLWLAASDVLLLVGTAANDDSYRYTAPMKVFEYFAAGRPVIASDTPALRSFVPEDAARYVPPDDAEALARAIRDMAADPEACARYVDKAAQLARRHTWGARAKRIAQKFLTK